jgi:hypothetical protein
MIALVSNQDGVHITLRNAGVGPALIEDARVSYQGREIEITYASVYGERWRLRSDRIPPERL